MFGNAAIYLAHSPEYVASTAIPALKSVNFPGEPLKATMVELLVVKCLTVVLSPKFRVEYREFYFG
jgi:hypothetical protein